MWTEEQNCTQVRDRGLEKVLETGKRVQTKVPKILKQQFGVVWSSREPHSWTLETIDVNVAIPEGGRYTPVLSVALFVFFSIWTFC